MNSIYSMIAFARVLMNKWCDLFPQESLKAPPPLCWPRFPHLTNPRLRPQVFKYLLHILPNKSALSTLTGWDARMRLFSSAFDSQLVVPLFWKYKLICLNIRFRLSKRLKGCSGPRVDWTGFSWQRSLDLPSIEKQLGPNIFPSVLSAEGSKQGFRSYKLFTTQRSNLIQQRPR